MKPLALATPIVSNGLHVRCAWCGRYKHSDGQYYPLAEEPAKHTDGICADCTHSVLAGYCAQRRPS